MTTAANGATRADTAPTAHEPPLFGPDSKFQGFFDDPRWALAIVRATVLEAAPPAGRCRPGRQLHLRRPPWRRLRNTFLSMRRMSAPTPPYASGRPPG